MCDVKVNKDAVVEVIQRQKAIKQTETVRVVC